MKKRNILILGLFLTVIFQQFGLIPQLDHSVLDSIYAFFKTINLKSDVLVPAIVGMLSSATVSTISYYLFVRFMRPSLDLHDQFACSHFGAITEYQFKVINKSRSEASGVRAELHLISSINAGNGKIARSRSIKLTRSDPMNLSPYKEGDGMCATRFITEEPLDALWDDESSYLRLLVHCSHSDSNLGKTFYQEFFRKDHSLVHGEFKVGTSFYIMRYESTEGLNTLSSN